MRTNIRGKILAIFAITAGALALSSAPALAAPSGGAYTCNGGDIPSGTYSSITVAGPCSVASGATITVTGSVTVRSGAMLDAQSAPATITIGRNVTALKGSMLGLGCQPPALVGNSAHPCATDPDGHSTITVKGQITALGAMAVLLNGITVHGNVTAIGGGSDEIPWSIKNNVVDRNITVTGQTTEWVGVMFNRVGGNVTLIGITLHDPDPGAPGVYIVQNKIARNLVCFDLKPGVSGGFVPGAVNVVGHKAVGQCTALV
jgi:hypothetical protein